MSATRVAGTFFRRTSGLPRASQRPSKNKEGHYEYTKQEWLEHRLSLGIDDTAIKTPPPETDDQRLRHWIKVYEDRDNFWGTYTKNLANNFIPKKRYFDWRINTLQHRNREVNLLWTQNARYWKENKELRAMLKELKDKQTTTERAEKLNLKLVSTDGTEPFNGCWLLGLEPGTVFLIREKADKSNLGRIDFNLGEFHLMGFTDSKKSAFLYSGRGNKTETWVEPNDFCRRYNLHEIIMDGKEVKRIAELNDKLKEQENAEGVRPDQPGGLDFTG